jgi:hypothetical protein
MTADAAQEAEKPLTRAIIRRFSQRIRNEEDNWNFDYWASADPSGELHSAGAILVEHETGDVRLGSGLQNAEYWGSAYTVANSEAALETIQKRLANLGWTLANLMAVQLGSARHSVIVPMETS